MYDERQKHFCGGVVIDDGGAVEVWCGGGVVMVELLESCQV